MKFVMYAFVILVVVVLCAAAYVRLAPSDVARWHQPITADGDMDMPTGAIRVIEAEPQALAQADAVMRALPRTRVLSGSVDEGRITYVTRSKLWGFPDYTTVEYGDGRLKLHARLRFGGSDLGVNAARLSEVLVTIQG